MIVLEYIFYQKNDDTKYKIIKNTAEGYQKKNAGVFHKNEESEKLMNLTSLHYYGEPKFFEEKRSDRGLDDLFLKKQVLSSADKRERFRESITTTQEESGILDEGSI